MEDSEMTIGSAFILLGIALTIAAREAYHAEVVETDMEDLIIGRDGEFETKAEWITSRVDDWLVKAVEVGDAEENRGTTEELVAFALGVFRNP